MNEKKVIAVVGPTGSGKTEWARRLADKFNGRVISADSRQVYKGMDIGTNKDKSFKQDMIDVVEPTQKFTVADFQDLTLKLINEYLTIKALPIISGGTGLYVNAVLQGYVLPALHKESEALREKLEKLSESELFEKLKEVDPAGALKVDKNNKRRLVRAVEYAVLSGKSFWEEQKKKSPAFKSIIVGINVDREKLYSKVDARVEKMIKDGLVEEVRKLIEKHGRDLPIFNTIGYKEIIDYLNAQTTLKEAIEKIKLNTHDYIRRQETWFRKNPNIKWFDRYEDAEKAVEEFLKN